jgi:site-specific DNA-methyltransferase (adenine-specific)
VENVLKWGTGGINIDECRIGTFQNTTPSGMARWNDYRHGDGKYPMNATTSKEQGRFPANIIFDEESAVLLDEQTGIRKSGGKVSGKEPSTTGQNGIYGHYDRVENQPFNDIGGASRFFYCAKTSKSERGEGNTHPTVKPIKLMEYLIKLVTPPNGIVLDPFSGSGSTIVSAINLGFNYIGFELDEGYYNIACQRIERVKGN